MKAKKLNIVVMGSTQGTDLPVIINAIKKKKLNAKISLIISNKPAAGIVEKAIKHKLPFAVIQNKGMNREEHNALLIDELKKINPDLILLIGWMTILNPEFVKEYGNKTMNIHPSLLPAFAGRMDKDVHKAVLDSGIKKTGCTLHFITDKADEGPIILQETVLISKKETEDSLKKKVQKAEQRVLIKAVKLY